MGRHTSAWNAAQSESILEAVESGNHAKVSECVNKGTRYLLNRFRWLLLFFLLLPFVGGLAVFAAMFGGDESGSTDGGVCVFSGYCPSSGFSGALLLL